MRTKRLKCSDCLWWLNETVIIQTGSILKNEEKGDYSMYDSYSNTMESVKQTRSSSSTTFSVDVHT